MRISLSCGEVVDLLPHIVCANLCLVYSTNQRLLANNTGIRLENLFWRIWSNKKLRTNIGGSRVASLFHGISEGDSMILEHAEPSSSKAEQPSRRLESTKMSPQVRSAPTATEHHRLRTIEVAETSFTERRRGTAQGARPPPILKKPCGDSSNQLSKTARILTPTWKTERQSLPEELDDNGDELAVLSPSVASDTHPSPNPSKSQLVIDETLYSDSGKPTSKISSSNERTSALGAKRGEVPSSAKSKSRKPTFVASTASSKRRQQMTRRKSSNSSGPSPKAPTPGPAPRLPASDAAPSRSLPPNPPSDSLLQGVRQTAHKSPLPPRSDFLRYEPLQLDRPPSRSPKPPSVRSSRSASPVLSRPAGEHVMQPARDDGTAGTQTWLVDVDFKAKFANKLRQQAEAQKSPKSLCSKTSTSSTSKRSELSAKGKGKSMMILGADHDEEAEGDYKASTSAIQSSDDEPDYEQEPVTAVSTALQKTKSQLTLLLEMERRREKEREKRGKNGKGRGR